MTRSTSFNRQPERHDHAQAELLDFHLGMLLDEARMAAYEAAITRLVRPGDVVVDIGAGTGVLSFLACRAGARRVYAVEGGPVAEIARELSEANGFSDRVVFVDGWSTEVDLPEPADVLLTETIGNAGFDEGIIAWAQDARKRLLRPDGLILPRRVRMVSAAVEAWDDHAQVADWSAPSLPFDFSVVQRRAERMLWFSHLRIEQLLTEPVVAAEVDLTTSALSVVVAAGSARVVRDGTLHGVACWFEADLVDGVTLTNSPPTPAPSWGQGFLPVPQPLAVSAGAMIDWKIDVSADGQRWGWTVEPSQLRRDEQSD